MFIITVVPKTLTQSPHKTRATFFTSVIFESPETDIECNMAGSVMDNVTLVVAPNSPMMYSRCGTMLATTAERKIVLYQIWSYVLFVIRSGLFRYARAPCHMAAIAKL